MQYRYIKRSRKRVKWFVLIVIPLLIAGTEILAVQIFRFAEDGLWGRLTALGIMMMIIATAQKFKGASTNFPPSTNSSVPVT